MSSKYNKYLEGVNPQPNEFKVDTLPDNKDFLKDIDDTLNLVSKIDDLDISKLNKLNSLSKEIKTQNKRLKKKYKNLDTKE